MTLTAGTVLSYLASMPCGGAAWSGFPIDDAWIHQVFARSVARGMPFQYNPGEPETGATSPLWVLLLAPIHLFHLPVVVTTRILGILLTAAAAGLARWRTVDSARRPLLAAIAAAIRPLGPAVVVTLPWIAYCIRATGRPLPSTYYMKTEWLGAFNIDQLRKIGLFPVGQPFLGATVEGRLVVVLGAGVAAVLLLLGAVRLQRASTSALLTIGVFPVLFLHGLSARLYFGAEKGPDQSGSIANFYYARYLLPAVPFLLMIWRIGLSRLDSRVQRRLALRLTVAIACLAISAVSLVQQQVRLRSIFPRNCDDIERLDVEGGKWIATHLPPDASVGVSDAGALSYFGERRIVDLAGLNTHRLVPLLLEL